MRKHLVSVSAVIGGILIWELSVRLSSANTGLLPAPSGVARSLLELAREGHLLQDSWLTLRRIGVGYLFGVVTGTVAGFITGRISIADRILSPWFNFLRSVSPVALVPFSILLFGLTEIAKYGLVAWGVFFPVWISAHLGARSVDPSLLNAGRVLGMKWHQRTFELYPLASLPLLLSGARTAIGIAFICALVSEMTGAGATAGLGYRVALAYQVFRADIMLAGLVVLGLLGLCADVLFHRLSVSLFPWSVHSQGEELR